MNKSKKAQSRLSVLSRRRVKDSRELGAALREMLDIYAAEAQAELNQANLELYDALVERCPKESGRLAAGFQAGVGVDGAAKALTPEPGDYRAALESITAANRARIAACKPGESLAISNNVEYLEEVERGGGAARGGFMSLPLREHALKLRRLARKFGKFKI